MSDSIILALLWGISANLIAMRSNRFGGAQFYVLIAAGIPILGLVTMQHGPWFGLLLLLLGMSVLRWPVVELGRRLRTRTN